LKRGIRAPIACHHCRPKRYKLSPCQTMRGASSYLMRCLDRLTHQPQVARDWMGGEGVGDKARAKGGRLHDSGNPRCRKLANPFMPETSLVQGCKRGLSFGRSADDPD
jgi:hypothetical protein